MSHIKCNVYFNFSHLDVMIVLDGGGMATPNNYICNYVFFFFGSIVLNLAKKNENMGKFCDKRKILTIFFKIKFIKEITYLDTSRSPLVTTLLYNYYNPCKTIVI